MKWNLLLYLSLVFIIGCKDDELIPEKQTINRTLLEKYIWTNQIEVEEQYTDQAEPIKYLKTSSFSFTPNQYTHKVESSLQKMSNMDVFKFTPELENMEIWGDYQISDTDSTLTIQYKTNLTLSEKKNNQNQDNMYLQLRYKILKLTINELALKQLLDSTFTTNQPIITFKPIRNSIY